MELRFKRTVIVFVFTYVILFPTFSLTQLSVFSLPSWPVHNFDTGLSYKNIQEAIDAPETLDGHTILVEAGTYYEHVTVSKSVALVGENPSTTIIDAGGAQVVVVYVVADNVKVSGFTILRSGGDPPGSPWPLKSGICLDHANNITINGNILESNQRGILTYYSSNSIIHNNTFSLNGENLDLRYLTSSKIFHNNLINDWFWQLYRWRTANNAWHDGAGRGNYWSDYQGEDLDGDGVGDTSIPHHGVDYNPLMNPASPPYRLVAKFVYSPFSPRVNEIVTFDASSSLPSWNDTVIPIAGYTWDFGDGNTIITVNPIVSHQYVVDDTYQVTLNITDTQGNCDTVSKTITVASPHGPTARFTCSSYHPSVDWRLAFDASSSLPGWNGTHETPIVSYEWNFGDGTQSIIETDPIATHIYSVEDNYTVTLKVTDSHGLLDIVTKNITVYPTPPFEPQIYFYPRGFDDTYYDKHRQVWSTIQDNPEMVELASHGDYSALVLYFVYGSDSFGRIYRDEWWVIVSTLQPDEHGLIYALVFRLDDAWHAWIEDYYWQIYLHNLTSIEYGTQVMRDYIDRFGFWFSSDALDASYPPFLTYYEPPMDLGIMVIMNSNTGKLMIAAVTVWMGCGDLIYPVKCDIDGDGDVDIDPNTLDSKSDYEWVTCYIELPESYNVSDIDVSSILLNDTIPVDGGVPTEIGDYDSDGIPDLMVQFNRTELTAHIYHVSGIIYGNVTLTITGQLTDGTTFEGSDTVKTKFGGDADSSGQVDLDDFYLWRENWGKTADQCPPGVYPDFNNNGMVELWDFYVWWDNFGATVPPPP